MQSPSERAFVESAAVIGKYDFDAMAAALLEMIFQAWAREIDASRVGTYERLMPVARKWLGIS